MARIAGVNLPPKKRIEIALSYVFGIGRITAVKILKIAKIDLNKKAGALTPQEEGLLREIIEKNYRVEGDLRREVLTNIKRLKDIGSYRGNRHSKNLPSRGQRTKTNSRTRRGNVRKTMGSGRKSTAQKT